MASLTTKFSIGDTCYTFEYTSGIISRYIISGISLNTSHSNTEIMYSLKMSSNNIQRTGPQTSTVTQAEEQVLYTELEVKEIANTWLLEKSVSIFSNAGL